MIPDAPVSGDTSGRIASGEVVAPLPGKNPGGTVASGEVVVAQPPRTPQARIDSVEVLQAMPLGTVVADLDPVGDPFCVALREEDGWAVSQDPRLRSSEWLLDQTVAGRPLVVLYVPRRATWIVLD